MQQPKLKVLIIKYYDISKIYCLVPLVLQQTILSFQSSILHKPKNILNCHLKLNKDNNWFFWSLTLLVLSNLKLLIYKLQKILNNVKCRRNFEYEKQNDQNFITQNFFHGNIEFPRKRNC